MLTCLLAYLLAYLLTFSCLLAYCVQRLEADVTSMHVQPWESGPESASPLSCLSRRRRSKRRLGGVPAHHPPRPPGALPVGLLAVLRTRGEQPSRSGHNGRLRCGREARPRSPMLQGSTHLDTALKNVRPSATAYLLHTAEASITLVTHGYSLCLVAGSTAGLCPCRSRSTRRRRSWRWLSTLGPLAAERRMTY